jgi:GSH-dependent disulfide-bond oxidoreductase
MVGRLPFMDVPREPMEAAPHVKAAACARNLDLTVCDDARLQGALLVPTRRPVGDLHRGDHHALIALAGRDDLTSVGGVPESLVTPPSAKSMPRTGGQLMLKFYYNTAPNPTKVALLLEELGLPYEAIPLDTRKGEQFKPEYLAINPNAKAPSIVDGDVKVFDSNAILLYLAEKTGKFLPENTPAARGPMLSWLMFVASGIGPYSGQSVHFKNHAPEKLAYAINRYDYEARRHFGILDAQLAKNRYMLGNTYTIVDMAVWGWARLVPFVIGEDAFAKMPNLKRLVDEISARPAAQRALAIKDKNKHAF